MKTGHHPARAYPLMVLVVTLSACSVLAPRPDRSRLFILTPGSDESVEPASAHPPAIGLGPIDFPGYLKRPEVVTRADADRLELSDIDRWAEPLDSNFESVLAQDLGRLLVTQRVALFPWYGSPDLDYRVQVQVHRFDTGSDGQAHLTADWTIADARTETILLASRTDTTSAAGTGDQGIPAALSRDIETLSQQIAEQILKLNQARPAPDPDKAAGGRVNPRKPRVE